LTSSRACTRSDAELVAQAVDVFVADEFVAPRQHGDAQRRAHGGVVAGRGRAGGHLAERRTRQARQGQAGRDLVLARQFLGRDEDIVVDVERGAHGQHASMR
jgi:hypothetical protein